MAGWEGSLFGLPINSRPGRDARGLPILEDFATGQRMPLDYRIPVRPEGWQPGAPPPPPSPDPHASWLTDAMGNPTPAPAGQATSGGASTGVGAVAQALAGGIWDGISAPGRAARGEPVTYGDAFGTALDALGGGAAGAIPEGALGANSFRAYHGSPHAFDRFSLDRIGTGEGAQAYGHGLYFADEEGVARGYRDALSGTPDMDTDPAAYARWYMGRNGLSPDEAAPALEDMATRFSGSPHLARPFVAAARAIRSGEAETAALPGHLYEVQINADPASFLDWDAPLVSQPAPVREALTRWDSQLAEELALPLDHITNPTYGSDLVSGARRPERLSQDLKDAGIPGIRYLDGDSRAAGAGSRNTVVFDDRLIEILRRYGFAGATAAGAGAAASSYGQPTSAEMATLRDYLGTF